MLVIVPGTNPRLSAPRCGVYVWDGIILEDDVFCGPNATFTNDLHPRSRQRPAAFANDAVGKGGRSGPARSSCRESTIGENALVSASAVVTEDVAPGQTVVGNPARTLAGDQASCLFNCCFSKAATFGAVTQSA